MKIGKTKNNWKSIYIVKVEMKMLIPFKTKFSFHLLIIVDSNALHGELRNIVEFHCCKRVKEITLQQ